MKLLVVALFGLLAFAVPTVVLAQAPAGTETLALRLRARHARDLPTPAELRSEADLARLRWLAEHDRRIVVRARALLSLVGDRAVSTRALVLRVLDSGAPTMVRAAALRATTGWSIDATWRARLETWAESSDPRLRAEALARLGADVPAGEAPPPSDRSAVD